MQAVLADVGGAENSGVNATTRRILVLSEENFVSQSLVEAISKHITDCAVTYRSPQGSLPANSESLRLVVIYNKSATGLSSTAEMLHERYPNTAICAIVESLEGSAPAVRELVERQIIKGVLPINLRFDVFMSAIDLLMKGGEHFPASLISNLKDAPSQSVPNLVKEMPRSRPETATPLTTREVEILNLICEGVQNKNIAYRLKLSENTVKVHVRNIYKKMKVRNRTEAAYLYFKRRGDGSSGPARA